MGQLEYVVICVGAGGTGGNFIKEFTRFARHYDNAEKSIKIVLVDGDRAEEKNKERQPFTDEDMLQNKALSLASAIKDTFDYDDIFAYPDYINEAAQLHRIFKNISSFKESDREKGRLSVPVLVGAVDNHRARQCMHEFYDTCTDIFYIDSANEWSVGEVVIAGKVKGSELAPPRGFYYPEILTDTSPSVAESGCGAVNKSTPQHLATNLTAASLLLSALAGIIADDRFNGGIVYFDREAMFSRFEKYGGKV